MMKQQFNEPPPPYGATTAQLHSIHHPSLLTSQLSHQLSQLPSRLNQAHNTQATAQSSRDMDVLSLLVPHIESLLGDMGATAPPPSLAELILVPEAAVPSGWRLSDEDDRRDGGGGGGVMRRLTRVEAAPRGAKGEKRNEQDDGRRGGVSERMQEEARGPHAEFDEWGRWGGDAVGSGADSSVAAAERWDSGEWWWSDEDGAARLARHLQPAAASSASSSSTLQKREEAVMTVRAEEVTFRRENEFGVWESRSGWAIAVRVRVRLRRA